jgi:6-phosphofructokinase 1
VILIPEIPFRYEAICKKVDQRVSRGSFFSIIAVSEGASVQGQEQVFLREGDSIHQARLGGISHQVAEYIARVCDVETRVTILGHLQRGGSPTPFDRWLATRLAAEAVRAVGRGELGCMSALQVNTVVTIPLSEALATPKRVNINGDTVMTARSLGISLGD